MRRNEEEGRKNAGRKEGEWRKKGGRMRRNEEV